MRWIEVVQRRADAIASIMPQTESPFTVLVEMDFTTQRWEMLFGRMWAWCEDNCRANFYRRLYVANNIVVFLFDDPSDAIGFRDRFGEGGCQTSCSLGRAGGTGAVLK